MCVCVCVMVSRDLQAIGMERRWYQCVRTDSSGVGHAGCCQSPDPRHTCNFVIVEEDLVISPDIRNSVHKNLVSCPGFSRVPLSQKSFCGRPSRLQGVCVCVCVLSAIDFTY